MLLTAPCPFLLGDSHMQEDTGGPQETKCTILRDPRSGVTTYHSNQGDSGLIRSQKTGMSRQTRTGVFTAVSAGNGKHGR